MIAVQMREPSAKVTSVFCVDMTIQNQPNDAETRYLDSSERP
jgi:hypothetical protein